jgi:hypothetical protein
VSLMKRVLLKAVSGGGWLANALNQLPDGFRGDTHVRPFLAIWFIAFFGLVSVMFFPLSPTGMRRGGVLLDLVALSISFTFGFAAVVTSVGLLAGYVPFVPSAAEGPHSTNSAPTHAPEKWPMFLTGVVEERGQRRRYRSRSGTLTRTASGLCRLEVRTWSWWWGQRGLARHGGSPLMQRYVASSVLQAADIANVGRGFAYLLFSEKPAIRLNWKHGPLIIAFGDSRQRDEVFAWLKDQSEASGQYRDREGSRV